MIYIATKGMQVALWAEAMVLGGLSGATYLGVELYRYNDLKQRMPIIGPTPPPSAPPMISSCTDEWLIIGRQSPYYAFDKFNPAKKSAQISPQLYIKGLGTIMDNERHYELFKGSDFKVEPCTATEGAPVVNIKSHHMLETKVANIKNSDRFELGFARKQGFANITQKSPFYHSALGFRRISRDRPADPNAVVLTGAEVKQLIAATEAKLCAREHCDLLTSNCYSASLFAMAEAIEILHNRKPPQDPDLIRRDIRSIHAIMEKAAFDNCAQGVRNNSTVKNKITTGLAPILEHHDLLTRAQASQPYGLDAGTIPKMIRS